MRQGFKARLSQEETGPLIRPWHCSRAAKVGPPLYMSEHRLSIDGHCMHHCELSQGMHACLESWQGLRELRLEHRALYFLEAQDVHRFVCPDLIKDARKAVGPCQELGWAVIMVPGPQRRTERTCGETYGMPLTANVTTALKQMRCSAPYPDTAYLFARTL